MSDERSGPPTAAPARVHTVAIQSPGDMGHGIGQDLIERGFAVITCLAGRSERSRTLASQAGMTLVDSLETMVTRADIVLSIVPPAAAVELAQQIGLAMRETGQRPAYADCNAISTQSARQVGECLAETGCTYIDAGIIGLAPGKSALPTRLYCAIS